MDHQLSKSPETLHKEAALKELQKQLKKRKIALKRLKTRLQNTKDEIDAIQRRVQFQLFSKLDDIQMLREEIIELAQELKKVKKINKDDRMALDQMIEELVDGEMFGDTFHQYQEQKEIHSDLIPENEEERRAKLEDIFAQFQVKPEESEQRDIRKIFLDLSKVFHPDRAKDEEERSQFHEMMQQINEAYEASDVQTLLDLENTYLKKTLDISANEVTIDTLDLQIDRLNREMHFIENQIERTSAEIKNLRESQLGFLKSNFNKAERAGHSFDEITEGFDEMVVMFTKLRDGLADSIVRKELSPILIEMLVDDAVEEAALQEFMEMMGLESLEDLFEEEVDEEEGGFYDELEVDNPKFPIDASVQIVKSVYSPYLKKMDMKGWVGRVIDVYYDEDDMESVIYEIAFDSKTMMQMPKGFVQKAIYEAEDFQTCALHEQYLEATKPRDTEDESFGTYRELVHKYCWRLLPPAQQKRLQKILLFQPFFGDAENWNYFFEVNLPFPFQAETREMLDSEAGMLVKVHDFLFYDEAYGHIVQISIQGVRGKREYPLGALQGIPLDKKTSQILDDYHAWAQEMLIGLM